MPKLRDILRKILDTLFVDKYNCIICDAELKKESRYGICDRCMAELPFNDNRICLKCGKVIFDEADYCITCENNELEFDIARSALIYKDDVRKLVYKLKFAGRKYIVKYIVNFYVDTYIKYGYNADVIVSVPISAKTEKKRGYNQSDIIARALAERLRLPYIEDAVSKIKDVAAQESLSGKERMDNVKGVYKIENREAIRGKNVLLIDDVLTTGATASAVSHELKKVSKRVEVITLASPEFRSQGVKKSIEEDYGLK